MNVQKRRNWNGSRHARIIVQSKTVPLRSSELVKEFVVVHLFASTLALELLLSRP